MNPQVPSIIRRAVLMNRERTSSTTTATSITGCDRTLRPGTERDPAQPKNALPRT